MSKIKEWLKGREENDVMFGPYRDCPDCAQNEWTVRPSRLMDIFNSKEKKKHPFCNKDGKDIRFGLKKMR